MGTSPGEPGKELCQGLDTVSGCPSKREWAQEELDLTGGSLLAGTGKKEDRMRIVQLWGEVGGWGFAEYSRILTRNRRSIPKSPS